MNISANDVRFRGRWRRKVLAHSLHAREGFAHQIQRIAQAFYQVRQAVVRLFQHVDNTRIARNQRIGVFERNFFCLKALPHVILFPLKCFNAHMQIRHCFKVFRLDNPLNAIVVSANNFRGCSAIVVVLLRGKIFNNGTQNIHVVLRFSL